MKKVLVFIAATLFIIAANMTYQNFFQQSPDTGRYEKEEVVKVLGKYTPQFDGIEAQTGFLVESKSGLDVIPFDKGSMAEAADIPPYLSVYWPKEQERPIVTPAVLR